MYSKLGLMLQLEGHQSTILLLMLPVFSLTAPLFCYITNFMLPFLNNHHPKSPKVAMFFHNNSSCQIIKYAV